MEFNAELQNRDTEQRRKKEEIFAPVMSPSWSKSSRRSAKKAAETKKENSSLKDKVKNFFS